MREHSGFRKIAIREQRSHMRHLEQLTKRIEKMSNMLMRLKQSAPALKGASAIMVERAEPSTSSFSYSFSRSENGMVTASFSFKIQFKPAGEGAYQEVAAPAAPVKADVPVATTDPVVEERVAVPATDAGEAARPEAPPQTFDERVAQLISYYRITIDLPQAGENREAAPEKAPAAVEAAEADNAPDVEARDRGVINVSADRARSIRTGEGDDTVIINADRARRVRTGGGDDMMMINADKVSRINSGSGDDFVDLVADKVSRIRSGSGDDVVNIESNHARHINTGSGDDVLAISADKISRVYTGSGDDTLNLSADKVSRVNAGAGDDTISLEAEDAAIYFGKGGGEDVINIKSVGALAIRIDEALAGSSEDMNVVREEGSITLEFASGERLTINNVENADMVSVKIGGETVDLHLSEPAIELDMSA